MLTISSGGNFPFDLIEGSSRCSAMWLIFLEHVNKSTPIGTYGETSGAGYFFLSLQNERVYQYTRKHSSTATTDVTQRKKIPNHNDQKNAPIVSSSH